MLQQAPLRGMTPAYTARRPTTESNQSQPRDLIHSDLIHSFIHLIIESNQSQTRDTSHICSIVAHSDNAARRLVVACKGGNVHDGCRVEDRQTYTGARKGRSSFTSAACCSTSVPSTQQRRHCRRFADAASFLRKYPAIIAVAAPACNAATAFQRSGGLELAEAGDARHTAAASSQSRSIRHCWRHTCTQARNDGLVLRNAAEIAAVPAPAFKPSTKAPIASSWLGDDAQAIYCLDQRRGRVFPPVYSQ